MHNSLTDIPNRILNLALASLKQATTRSALIYRENPDADQLSVLNAAHAGELIIKAIIAREHPLLLFKNLFETVRGQNEDLDVSQLLRKGQTHDFSKLPDLLFATTGQQIYNIDNFNKIRTVRNQIQHFLAANDSDFSSISLRFIFETIDPLLLSNFGLHAINFHEDEFPDYIVKTLVHHEIKFSVPKDFALAEVNLAEGIDHCSPEYLKFVYENLIE